MPILFPYGSWKSPITAELVASSEIGLEQIRLDGDDIYWIERRAQEGGRKVIGRRKQDDRVTDITPTGFNARTLVHEYGGGDYAVAEGTVIFSNFTDQRLYRQDRNAAPKPLTAEPDVSSPALISETPTEPPAASAMSPDWNRDVVGV